MRTCRSLAFYGGNLTYFCTNCWQEIEKRQKVCLHCRTDQDRLGREPFVQKLIRALSHPTPETPIRAAYVLGRLKTPVAVEELAHVLRMSPDPYIAAACAQALGRIGGISASEALRNASKIEHSVITQHAIRNALEEIDHSENHHE